MTNSTGKCPFHAPRFPDALRDIDNPNMDGKSDLIIWAPIKEGFIDAFSNITYETRLRTTAEALNKLRKNLREFQLVEPFTDPTERILSLHGFRIGVIDRDIFGYDRTDNAEGKTLRPRQYMYLTATFDGPWEPYMRQIWRPLGSFLDLVLCNCDGYKPAATTDFAEYIQWVRDHLMDTAFFYVVSGVTVKDEKYQGELERIHREEPSLPISDAKIATLTTKDPDEISNRIKLEHPESTLRLGLEGLNVLYQLTSLYSPDRNRGTDGIFLHKATRDLLQEFPFREHLESIKNLDCGAYCNQNPSDNCKEFCQLEKEKAQAILRAFDDQFNWYDYKFSFETKPPPEPDWTHTEIQKGILTSYEERTSRGAVTHGALLMLKIVNPEAARVFMHPAFWSWEEDKQENIADYASPILFRNISITYSGLKKLGLSETELRAFPKEFRQGMEERAPMLGDSHHNHPRRWSFIDRNWPAKEDYSPPVRLDEVDLIVQLRVTPNPVPDSDVSAFLSSTDFIEFDKIAIEKRKSNPGANTASQQANTTGKSDDTGFEFEEIFGFPLDNTKNTHPEVFEGLNYLHNKMASSDKKSLELIPDFILALADLATASEAKQDSDESADASRNFLGVEILAIENAFRPNAQQDAPATKDHFGFIDGISQPKIVDENFKDHPMHIKRGDLLIGHSTLLEDDPIDLELKPEKDIQINGSFLAIRKMRQNAGEFEKFLQHEQNKQKLPKDKIASLLMGRNRDGSPLIPNENGPNSFTYKQDKQGLKCPLVSHIRRANPRNIEHKRHAPKILRRGMSYGQNIWFDENDDDISHAKAAQIDKTERGVLFMAYCSNISEQYETIQRWINGGNSTNISSLQSDPITGPLPKDGRSVTKIPMTDDQSLIKTLRFERRTESVTEGDADETISARPFVKLEWGAYSFVPARSTLEKIYAGKTANQPLVNYLERGKAVVDEIENLPSDAFKRQQWKVLLEDALTKDEVRHNISPNVWTYIREERGGAYRIESGIDGVENYQTGTSKDKESERPVVLVMTESLIDKVLSNHEAFSSTLLGDRLEKIFERHHVGIDPTDQDQNYHIESKRPNEVFYNYSQETAYQLGYEHAKTLLDKKKFFVEKYFRDKKREFKIELTREYISPLLTELTQTWFGIPGKGSSFESGPWKWDMDETSEQQRPTRCPGDFLAPSRGAFYPRPTEAIYDHAKRHGAKLKQSINKVKTIWKTASSESDDIGSLVAKMLPENREEVDLNLLGRNVIGSMIGMLPPMEANLRGILFDWIDQKSLWTLQGNIFKEKMKTAQDLNYDLAKKVLENDIARSMRKRPAPDLLYRIAKKDGVIIDGEIHFNQKDMDKSGSKITKFYKGDMIILSLVSATQDRNYDSQDSTDVDVIFGGKRHKGPENPEGNVHACPAQKMVMGSVLGFLTALLTAGKIQAMPASLILEISDWEPILGPDKSDLYDIEDLAEIATI